MFRFVGREPCKVISSSLEYLQASDPARSAPWISIPATSRVIREEVFSSKISSEVEGTVITPNSEVILCVMTTLELEGKVTSPDVGTCPPHVLGLCHERSPVS